MKEREVFHGDSDGEYACSLVVARVSSLQSMYMYTVPDTRFIWLSLASMRGDEKIVFVRGSCAIEATGAAVTRSFVASSRPCRCNTRQTDRSFGGRKFCLASRENARVWTGDTRVLGLLRYAQRGKAFRFFFFHVSLFLSLGNHSFSLSKDGGMARDGVTTRPENRHTRK